MGDESVMLSKTAAPLDVILQPRLAPICSSPEPPSTNPIPRLALRLQHSKLQRNNYSVELIYK